MRKLLFLLSTLFATCCASAQTTTIFGTNRTYANQTIRAVDYDDFISKKLIVIGETVADSLGNFELNLPINSPRLIKLELGAILGDIFVDTAQRYNVVLPPFKPKTKGNMLNPFFEPEELLIGVKGESINQQIDLFEYEFQDLIDQNYAKFTRYPNKHEVDSIIDDLEMHFDSIPNHYFETYRNYKYAWLRFMSYARDWRFISRDYFDNKPIEIHNEAYLDLFGQLYSNFISFYGSTREGERLYSDIMFSKSPVMAKQTLSNSLALSNDTLQEMVLLKGINDAFYGRIYNESSLLIMLDSIYLTSKIEQHRQIAKNITDRMTQIRVGSPAPELNLTDTAGNIHKISEFAGSYVYLNFVSTTSYPCVQSLEQIKKMNESTQQVLKIVSVCIDDMDKAAKYFKKNGYNWLLLNYKDNPSVIEKYRVQAYPAFYLIGPDGKFAISPAASPAENFEERFRKYYKTRMQRQQLQNTPNQ